MPGTNLLADSNYSQSRRGTYLEEGAVVARDAMLGQDTLIGAHRFITLGVTVCVPRAWR